MGLLGVPGEFTGLEELAKQRQDLQTELPRRYSVIMSSPTPRC